MDRKMEGNQALMINCLKGDSHGGRREEGKVYCSSNKAHNGTHITENYITYAPYSCVTADKTPTPCTYQFSVGLQHVQELLVVLGGCLHSGQGTSVHASSQLP